MQWGEGKHQLSKKCTAKKDNGERCGAWAMKEKTKCALHWDPERAAKIGSKHGRKAALPRQPDAAPMEPPKTVGDVRDALANTMAQVHDHKMDTRTANALAYVATSLLRAMEVADLETRLMAIEVRMEPGNGKP
jgi:hypothetical protein